MCGRTKLTAPPDELREMFGLADVPDVPAHYNVPPSQPQAVVRVLRGAAGRSMDLLKWGLVPWWADDPKTGHKLALARVETVATTPAFRDAFKTRRCLVVVDGFYEWKRDGKKSDPYVFRRADGKPFALAGLWEKWVSKDGEVIESCAILTAPAKPPVDAVHDRMPVVMPPESWDAWLDEKTAGAGKLVEAATATAGELTAMAVSKWVNDPKHDDARCVEKSEGPAQGQLF